MVSKTSTSATVKTLPSCKETYRTDSKTVLGYIKRCKKISYLRRKSSTGNSRKDIAGTVALHRNEAKPADTASRGSSVQELIDNRLWWNGPELLWKSGKDWILTDVTSKISPDDPEVKRGSVLATQVRKPSSVLEHMEYFSTWHRPKRAVAVCLRLQEKFRSRTKRKLKEIQVRDSRSSKYIPVNVQELQNAESEIIKIVQGTAFPEDIITMKLNVCERISGEKTVTHDNKAMKKASSLYQLDLFLDANGVLRVGGRIRRSRLSYGGKHPIIHPRKGHLSELIICHHHRIVEHQGCGVTTTK